MEDFEAIAGRPAAYLAETGMPQLSGGLVFLFIGSSILIQHFLPRTPLYLLGLQYAGLCCAIGVLLGTAAIKRKMVFPRGGYVMPRRRSQRWLFLSLMLPIAVAVWIFARTSPGHRIDLLDSSLIWPGFAILFAVLSLYSGRIDAGVYLACLAPVLWWLPVTSYERGACLEVAAGAPMAVIGAVRLRRYLLANPIPPRDAE
jgi:hypothetical protein